MDRNMSLLGRSPYNYAEGLRGFGDGGILNGMYPKKDISWAYALVRVQLRAPSSKRSTR